ncbi:MAG: hypothetical protein WCR72_14685 [Bacteroidota bacterium]
MARTIAEIYDALNLVKGNMSELGVYVNNDTESVDTAKKLVNDVRTASKVAIWRLWLWIVSVGSWVIENLQDLHEVKITSIIASDKPHTLNWYASQSKMFQYGHVIAWITDHFGYAIIDETAQVVKYSAAVEDETGNVTIKAMKAGRVILTTPELNAFKAFWNRWKDAGVVLNCISQSVNLLDFTVTIYRNRSILNADNTLIAEPSRNAVTDPANAYVNSIEFNGTVYLLELIQQIKNQPGIINVILSVGHIDSGTWSTDGLWTVIPNAGFCMIDWDACDITYSDVYE